MGDGELVGGIFVELGADPGWIHTVRSGMPDRGSAGDLGLQTVGATGGTGCEAQGQAGDDPLAAGRAGSDRAGLAAAIHCLGSGNPQAISAGRDLGVDGAGGGDPAESREGDDQLAGLCTGIGAERGRDRYGRAAAERDGLPVFAGVVGRQPAVGLFGAVWAGAIRLSKGSADTGLAGYRPAIRGRIAVPAAAGLDSGRAVVGGADLYPAVCDPGTGSIQDTGKRVWHLAACGVVGVYVFEPGADPSAASIVCDPGGGGVA